MYGNDFEERQAFLEEQGDLGKALLQNVHDNLEEAQRLMQNSYLGEWQDEEAYAREVYEERANEAKVPNDLRFPNYERYAEHLFTTECFALKVGHRTHVFLNN